MDVIGGLLFVMIVTVLTASLLKKAAEGFSIFILAITEIIKIANSV
jgi:hypothetical protein